MEEEGKLSSRFYSEINLSNTRAYSMNSKCVSAIKKSANKIANYLSALNEIKGLVQEYQPKKSPSMLNFTNMTNVSEFSCTDAIPSKEENVIWYISNPIEKNIYIENNDVKKRRVFSKNYLTSINIPYRMNDVFLRPVLEKIIENEEYQHNNEGDDGLPKKDFITVQKRYNKNLPKTSNKCSTSCTGGDSFQNSHCPEIKPFVVDHGVNISAFIQDLDEEKELDLSEYYKKSSLKCQPEPVKDTINTILSAVNVNISNLNINPSPDSENFLPNKFRNIYNKIENSNSNILIVDSLLNNSQLHISCDMSNPMKSSICTSYKNKIQNLKHTQKIKKKVSNNKKFLCEEFYNDDHIHIHMQIENEGSCIINNSLHKNKILSSFDKQMMYMKYFTNENLNFQSHGKKTFTSNKTNSREKTVSDIFLANVASLTKEKQEEEQIETDVNKNLLAWFNSCQEQSSVQLHKKEKLLEVEMINLVTDNDEGNESIGSSSRVIDNVNCNLTQTPVGKVRKTNRITDLIFRKSTLNHSSSLSPSKCNMSYGSSNDSSMMYTIFDMEFLANLLEREEHYKSNPDYISKHKGLKWEFRAILVDWLMEICYGFGFKRDTFHYTINYVDRFLSRTKNVNKKFLQLLGIASLSIAAKLEEVQIPKANEYLIATNNSYTEEEFCATEKHVLQILKWEILPTTINTWLNWYLCQWDLFIETIDGMKEKILLHLEELKQETNTNNNNNDMSNETCVCEYEIIFFIKPDYHAYFHYRQIAQLIDLYTVDSNSLKFSSRYLIAASMFLVLCTNHGIKNFRKEKKNKFDFDLNFFRDLLQSEMWLVDVFKVFLKQSFDISIEDPHLTECFVYCGRFLDLEFQYALPFVMQEQHNVEGDTANYPKFTNYEDFISYQTYNDKAFEFLQALNN